MGLVYAPQSIGKGATSGNFRFINNPRLVGIGGGTGAIRKGLRIGYRFVKTNYKLFTGITSVGVGAGVENLIGSSNNPNGKTYQPNYSNNRTAFNARNSKYDFRRTRCKPYKPKRSKCRHYCKGNLR